MTMKFLRGFPKLNSEISVCFLFSTGCILYSLYKIKLAGEAFDTIDDAYQDFSEGFAFINRKKDSADFEWRLCKKVLSSQALWLIVNFFISECLRATKCFQYLPYFQSTISIIYMLSSFNVYFLAIVLIQPIVFKISFKFQSKICIWMCGVIFLLILPYFINVLLKNEIVTNEYHLAQSAIITAWINLKCLSYYSDLIENKTSSSFVPFLAYCLYMPLLTCGPFIQYGHFKRSLQKSNILLHVRLGMLLRHLFQFLFWLLVTEVFLHYVYVNVISNQPEIIDKFDTWTRCGYYYSMGQFFHLKYVVVYGISTSFARAEGIVVPNVPKCIARIHLYSDMWKYFDAGLYTFLLRYIYMPTLKLTSHISIKFHAITLCFLFVYIWHGLELHIFIWVVLNYVEILLESSFHCLYRRYWMNNYDYYINPVWKVRIGCMLAALLLALSIVSSSYFFAGTLIANKLFIQCIHDDFKSIFVVLVALYCVCQFAQYYKNLEHKKHKSN